MEISSDSKDYTGRIEVWWVSDAEYRLVMSSPHFSQEEIVNGNRVSEKDDGDYYPRWLENFVLAILDPIPMEKNFRGRGGAVMLGERITSSCLRRDDRPGGITDQMTWGDVCFSGSEPKVASVQTMNVYIEFNDWKGFGEKQIARTYTTYVGDNQSVTGRLTALDELKRPNEAMFAVATETSAEQRITTEYVSTSKEESMVESAPKIDWPPVREGKTEGYMIVYARTDRTGQVRETAKHNSDQPGLESFGIEQALKYKFKPLVVNGVAEQMEMPLVLHFSSRVDHPIPVLSVLEMRQHIVSCKPAKIPAGVLAKGTIVVVRISVNEEGREVGIEGVGRAPWGRIFPALMSMKADCLFSPYEVNGHPAFYKGDLEMVAP